MNNLRFYYSTLGVLLFFVVLGNRLSANQPHREFPSNVHFVENKKQWEDFIKYQADFRGGKLFLEENRFTYVFYNPEDFASLHPHEGKQIDNVRLHAIKINPVNANPHPVLASYDTASFYNNYFIGKDTSKWASNVSSYSSVVYTNLYPNIDMKFYSSLSDIKYDFILNPGSNLKDIQLAYEGVDKLYLKNGSLIIHLSVGDIIEEKPFAYQIINNDKKEVACKFILKNNKISFRFPHGYDKSKPVIIDPILIFSSYTGSFADNWGFTATYDAAGDLYSGGNINAVGYPVTVGAYQQTYRGGGASGNGWQCDMAIAKFNPTGTRLLYATYLGGSDNETPQSLIVDGNDNLVIFGTSYSSNFPTTLGCFDSTLNGSGDIVISKLSPNGNILLGSTYVGGTADDGKNTDPKFNVKGPIKYNYSDEARGEIIADNNNDYIIGSCSKSSNFPVTRGTVQQSFGGIQDGVVFKINSSLTGMVWNTFIGGSKYDAVYDCVIDKNGDLYVTGGTNSNDFITTPGSLHPTFQGGTSDGFIFHMTSDGSAISTSTYIGTNSYDQSFFVELDYNGNVYCTGQTEGLYPVSSGVYSNTNGRQFIHKLDPALSSTIYSTVFGNGSVYPNISPTAFLVDTCENVYVAGWGRCLSLGSFTSGNVTGMPLTPNAYQSTTDGCDFYFFVLQRDALSLYYSTYFGGTSADHVDGGTSRFDKNGVIYESVCAGCGGNSNYPTTPGVVSNRNNSLNCNNGVIKLAFNLYKTISGITTSNTNGCAPFNVTFINKSINSVTYLMDFGDGSPRSTSPTATHTYTIPGVYKAMLIAYNNKSCNQNDTSYVDITVIAPLPLPTAFAVAQPDPCDSFFVNTLFTSNNGLLYNWNFGDGFSTGVFNPSHLYSDSGTYQITLTVTDTACPANMITLLDTVHFLSPAVSAAITPDNATSGCAPLSVSFTNSSSTSGNHYWDFMDGSALDTSYNTSHLFTIPGNYNVMFVVNDSLSCNNGDSAFVNVNVLPFIPVVPNFNTTLHSLCLNPSADFSSTGSGGNLFTWSFGDGFISYGANVTHPYSDAGDYIVTLTVDDTICGTTGSVSQVVSFYPPITASIAPTSSSVGCTPLNVSFSNNSSTTGNHFWNFMDGSPIDTSYNTTHLFTVPGNYKVMFVINDSRSCNRTDTSFVNIAVYPSIPVIPAFSKTLHPNCFSPSADFSFTGSGGNIYTWDFGDGNSATGINVSHTYSGGGDFTVTLTLKDTLCGTNATTSQVVSFYPPANASVNVSANKGCAPFSPSFLNNSSTFGNFYWNFMDGSAIDTSFNTNHTFTSPGNYNVMFIVNDSRSCNISDTTFVNITVLPSIPVIASFNTTLHPLCFSPSADFSFTGSGGNLYTWDFGDSTGSNGTNVSHSYSNAGDYIVTLNVRDTLCGATGSVSQVVSFYPPATASVNVSANTGCSPFTPSFLNNSTTNGNFYWNFMDGSAIDTSFNTNHTFTSPGNYNVMFIVNDSRSCNLADTAYVNITVLPSVPVVAAFNSTLHQNCNSPSADFSFTGSGGHQYTWDFGDGIYSEGTDVSHIYSNPGDYIVKLVVSDTVCGAYEIISKTISFYPAIVASVEINGSDSGCPPFTPSFLNNSSINGNYTWNFMDGSSIDTSFNATHTFTSPGIYQVRLIVSNLNSCNISDTDFVQVNIISTIPARASFYFSNTSDCDSTDATFTFNGIGGDSYLWNFGDGTFGSGVSNNHHYSQAGNYLITLIVTDSVCNLNDSVSHSVVVKPSIKTEINTNQILFGCAPQSITFSNTFNSFGNYLWDLGDNTFSSEHVVSHDYNAPGRYTIVLTVTDSSSCNLQDKAVYSLKVFETPKADFTFTQKNQPLYSEINFFDNSSTNSVYYRWDFADSTFENSKGPFSHKYYKRGSYNVCLHVTTIDGCADSTCQDIFIENEETIYIPSSFTPNGDGKNDFFKIYFTGLTEINVLIYDRWGKKIYEYNSLDGSWDGTFNGNRALEDVYVYKLTGKGIINEHIEKSGRVTLIY